MPYNLLSTIPALFSLPLHFPHLSFYLCSLYQFNIFIPSSLTEPAAPVSPLSPKPHPPPTLSPSVIIETKVGTPQSDHPSAGPLPPPSTRPPPASCPPTDSEPVSDRERRASSAGAAQRPSQVCSGPKPAPAQGRRGRKPPPYPHHRHTKEPRKAPPYPEKRRLLSTTV